MARKFEADALVWIRDPEECFVPAKALTTFSPGEPARVELQDDGSVVELDASMTEGAQPMDPQSLESIENMVKINDLNEAAVLHDLRLRFKKDVIYTYVSSILVSVNPFKMLSIYTPEELDRYIERGARDLPPHVFAIADNAYRSLLDEHKSQSVVISGESGAGKTEAMKLILQYLAEVSGRGSSKREGTESLEQQILKANPVMEAFGNAKTKRNNNSSRFGKWTAVDFNRGGTIVGGSIVNYLLEKSRVVTQSEGERNYHVFYQLCAGCAANAEMKQLTKVGQPSDYHYLSQSDVTTIEGRSEEKDFEDLRLAMDVLQMGKGEQEMVFRSLAAVLHLGNVTFEVDKKTTEEDGSRIANEEALQLVCDMVSTDLESTRRALTSRQLGAHSVIQVPYTVEQAQDARDALSKALYGKLFDWLINKINKSLSEGQEVGAEAEGSGEKLIIGVLDIFGFESFETNSFEQLCINYCNEKLQFHFNQHIFKLEQEEYRSEGIEVSNVDFADNQPCLDLLETPRTGVFSMIDEEISVPRGSDDGFLSKVLSNHGKHPNLKRPGPKEKDSRLCFTVAHYAGDVRYNTTNFLEKNKDSLHDDLRGAIRTSSEPFVVQLFAEAAQAGGGDAAGGAKRRAPVRRGGGRKKASKTLGSQFRQQLGTLMETLNATSPHFIRCMKPNSKKVGNLFESQMMMAQLRYAGLLEVCRIRQIGFPIRRPFDTFMHRYRCIVPGAADVDALVAALKEKGMLVEGEVAKGHSKVFMRAQAEPALEKAREEALYEVTVRIQALARRWTCRHRFLSFQRTREQLRAAVATRDESALDQWLGMCDELPYRGEHLAEVKEARALGVRLGEERRVLGLLREAVEARELSSLQSAIGIADGMGFAPPELAGARELVGALQHEKKVRDELRAAVAARDRAALDKWLAAAEEAGVESEEVAQGRTLRARLEEEEQALADLRGAMEARSLTELTAFLARMTELGLDSAPDVAKARSLRDKLQAEVTAKHAVRAAQEEGDLAALEAALQKAASVGVAEGELAEAKATAETLRARQTCERTLREAVEARDLARVQAALAEAGKLGLTARQSGEVEDAEQVQQELEKEKEALAALAAAGGDQTAARAAVRRCEELGLGARPEVAEAKSALKAAGQRGALQDKVQEAAGKGDEAAIEAAIAAAEGEGLGDSDEARDAKETLQRVQEQNSALAKVREAVAGNDATALASALKAATAAGAGAAHGAAEVKEARAALERLRAAERVAQQVRRAMDSGDADTLAQAMTRAEGTEGVDAALLAEAREAQAKFARAAELSDAVRGALEADDEAALGKALEAALAAGVETDAVRQGRLRVDRERLVRETRAALEEATEQRDLEALNKAFATAFELGLEEDDLLTRAKKARQELQGDDEVRQELSAAIRTLRLKAEGPSGITQEDIAPLEAKVQELEAAGVAAEEGRAFVARCHRQLEVQQRLATVAQPGAAASRREVASAIEAADELQLELTTLGQARERLRELDAEHRRKVAEGLEEEDLPDTGVEVPEDEDEDEDEVRRLRRERIERVRNPKYHFTRFKRLRSSDDFARGVLLNKKKVKAHQFMWQAKVLPKSLTLLEGRDDNRIARNVHKALLGYCGDRSMSFPPMLANDILNKGLMHPSLVDEIYVQICKHLTDNPGQESVHRAWQVMCMCVGTFPPSVDFQNYLMNFIVSHLEVPGPVGNYARYSLRRLEGIINSGSSGFVPSVDEIQAYNARPPILATVELVDGTPLTEELPITPDLNCQKVMEICNHFLELVDERATQFGIFTYDTTDEEASPDGTVVDGTLLALPMTPRPLRSDEFMGDVVVQKERAGRSFKFVYKRKIFLRDADPPSDDPMFERLVYLQAADEVIRGSLPLEDAATVERLVAQSVAIDAGEEIADSPDDLLADGLMEYVPMPWRGKKEEADWGAAVLAHRGDVATRDPADLQLEYVNTAKEHPLYGSTFFYVRKATDSDLASDLPEDMVCAFNSEGIHFLTMERTVVVSYGFADVYRWGGSEQTFSLIIWSAEAKTTFELQLYTTQAADMAGLILDYITAIMNSTSE